jgi:hypothetical protein
MLLSMRAGKGGAFWPNEAKVRRGSNGARRGDELRYAAIRDQSATEGMLACDISASLASR